MTQEEITEYLLRVNKLENKLTGEDKETLEWLIFGYNQCAKLLNEAEDVLDEIKDTLEKNLGGLSINDYYRLIDLCGGSDKE